MISCFVAQNAFKHNKRCGNVGDILRVLQKKKERKIIVKCWWTRKQQTTRGTMHGRGRTCRKLAFVCDRRRCKSNNSIGNWMSSWVIDTQRWRWSAWYVASKTHFRKLYLIHRFHCIGDRQNWMKFRDHSPCFSWTANRTLELNVHLIENLLNHGNYLRWTNETVAFSFMIRFEMSNVQSLHYTLCDCVAGSSHSKLRAGAPWPDTNSFFFFLKKA